MLLYPTPIIFVLSCKSFTSKLASTHEHLYCLSFVGILAFLFFFNKTHNTLHPTTIMHINSCPSSSCIFLFSSPSFVHSVCSLLIGHIIIHVNIFHNTTYQHTAQVFTSKGRKKGRNKNIHNMNPCAGKPKKPEMDEDGYPKKDLKTRIMNSKPLLVLNMLASLYTVFLGIRAYNAIGVGFPPYILTILCSPRFYNFL